MQPREDRSRSPPRPVSEPMRWTPLLPLLSDGGITSSALSAHLLDIILDRTVLFCELTDSALSDIALLEPPDSALIKACLLRIHQTASRCTPLREVSDPRRYLPEGSEDDSHVLGDPFELRSRRARPRGWTWLEFLAAGGLLTGSALGSASRPSSAKIIFSGRLIAEFVILAELSCPSSTRCHLSGCSWLMLSVQVDESLPSHRAPLWQGGPRQRLGQAQTPVPVSTLSPGWRYPEHLLAERVIRTQLQSIAGSWMSTRSAWFAWCAYCARTGRSCPTSQPPPMPARLLGLLRQGGLTG